MVVAGNKDRRVADLPHSISLILEPRLNLGRSRSAAASSLMPMCNAKDVSVDVQG